MRNDTPLMIATAALICVVLVYGVVKAVPVIYFDVDPRHDLAAANLPADAPPLTTMLGPVGTAWLDVLTVFIAAAAIALHARAGGRIRWCAALLVFIGCASCLYHMPSQVDNLKRAGHWLAAAAAGLAALHLAEHDRPRRYMAAAFVALLVPMSIAAVRYVWHEHAQTVAMFNENLDKVLASRGWVEGSPQHLLFVRRMESAEATGPFGLSNVFGSVLAACCVAAIGLTAALCAVRAWSWAAVTAVVTLVGLYGTYLTRSKGAAAAFLVGLIMLIVVAVSRRRVKRGKRPVPKSNAPSNRGQATSETDESKPQNPHSPRKKLIAAIGVAMVALTFAAIFMRGALGRPASPEGELSIYFRYQYIHAAARTFNAMPDVQKLTGIGPAAFRSRYLIHKDPYNPEDVISTHSVFIDHVTMLGTGGAAWSLLLIIWLWQSGSQALGKPCSTKPPPSKVNDNRAPPHTSGNNQTTSLNAIEIRPGQLVWPAAITGPIFLMQYVVASDALVTTGSILLWLVAAAGFLIVVTLLLDPPPPICPRLDAALPAALFAAAVVLLVHAQIEMTIFHHGAVAIAWLVLALAAARRALPDQPPRRVNLATAAVVVSILIIITAFFMLPRAARLSKQQSHLATAAVALRAGRVDDAIAQLDRAIQVLPTDGRSYRWVVDLHRESARRLAAQSHRDEATLRLDLALSALGRAADAGLDTLSLFRRRAFVHDDMARLNRLPDQLRTALTITDQLLTRSPYGLQDHLFAANLHWHGGDRATARSLYQKCIQLSEQSYLDPAKQLSSKQRAVIEQRLALP